jgi:WD40 repeat protein
VSGSQDKTIKVWDVTNGKLSLGPLVGHTLSVVSVSFSPDGKLIASGSNDSSVQVWRADTGYNRLGPFRGHTAGVNSIAFSPDGKRVASGSHDHDIRVWDVVTGQTVAGPFTGHTAGVKSVVFSPDGTRIASGSCDLSVRVWDAATGNPVSGPPNCFAGHTHVINCVVYSPDGKWIASCSDTLQVFDAETGHSVMRPVMEANVVISIAFSPDGKKIALSAFDNHIRIYEIRSIRITNCHGDGPSPVSPSPLLHSLPSPPKPIQYEPGGLPPYTGHDTEMQLGLLANSIEDHRRANQDYHNEGFDAYLETMYAWTGPTPQM